MRLYLIQTGEGLSKKTTDFDRPLSDVGRLNVEKLSSLLSRINPEAKQVIHSGNIRAQQTLEILKWATTRARGSVQVRSGLSPQDPVQPWVQEIMEWTDDAMIVGHQPFLGKLVSCLIAGREEPPVVLFAPGTAVCLEKGAAGWGIAWMIPPELVSALARY